MRIGQVNKDNYQDYLKLLGVKDTKNLDKMFGKDKTEDLANRDYSFEAQCARAVAAGVAVEGMIMREGDDSWKKIVDVSDDAKNAVINKVREIFIKRGDGMGYEQDGNDLGEVMLNHVKTLPPEERLSAMWTLEQIAREETGRINDFIKSQVSGWTNQSFDRRILTESNFGTDPNYLNKKA